MVPAHLHFQFNSTLLLAFTALPASDRIGVPIAGWVDWLSLEIGRTSRSAVVLAAQWCCALRRHNALGLPAVTQVGDLSRLCLSSCAFCGWLSTSALEGLPGVLQ